MQYNQVTWLLIMWSSTRTVNRVPTHMGTQHSHGDVGILATTSIALLNPPQSLRSTGDIVIV